MALEGVCIRFCRAMCWTLLTRWPQLKCGNCGEGTGKFSTVQAGEEVEVPGGRGTANLVQKCKMFVVAHHLHGLSGSVVHRVSTCTGVSARTTSASLSPRVPSTPAKTRRTTIS